MVKLTVFWEQHGVVMMDFLAEGTAVVGDYYITPLQKVREVFKAKRCRVLTKGVCLLQDSALVPNPHIAQMKALFFGYDILFLLTLHHLTFTSFHP